MATRSVRKEAASIRTNPDPARQARDAVATLKRLSSRKVLDGYARYGIPSDRAMGIPVGTIQGVAKKLGRNHALALALWKTGWYEARMLAVFVAEPDRVTPALMDRWCGDFDNWGITDTACFKLFDRNPNAMRKIAQWSKLRGEFQKRAAFALLASAAAHAKTLPDTAFVSCFPLIQAGAGDERNFVMKGVSWALRAVGHRNPTLHARAVALASTLAESESRPARWVGRDTLRDLLRPLVVQRMKVRQVT
jgi:3-methyladenine DNA glycosylase AlkD